jgi:hypothetical protein
MLASTGTSVEQAVFIVERGDVPQLRLGGMALDPRLRGLPQHALAHHLHPGLGQSDPPPRHVGSRAEFVGIQVIHRRHHRGLPQALIAE